MSIFLFLFFFIISFSGASSSFASLNNTTHKCAAEHRDALLQFKQNLSSSYFNESIYGPLCQRRLGSDYHPIMMNWNMSIDCCNWDGISCNTLSGDVIGLDLSCGMLQGIIHPNTTLFHLHRLQRLNLAYNDFLTSTIPYEMARFAIGLTHLNISHCGFVDAIPPGILFLPRLVSLDLTVNGVTLENQSYHLNSLLRNSTHLKELLLSDISISWVLPSYFNISSSLKSLQIKDTGLHGKLPDNIFNLQHLEKLDLSDNDELTGPLPKVIRSNNIPLQWLDLTYTNLSGEIPESIGQLKSLNTLRLSSCGLAGPLPKSLLNLTHLVNLDLSFNMLNGTLPSLLFTLPSLQNIDLSGNMFSGTIPSELFNHRSLKELRLGNNKFDGDISYKGSVPPSFIQSTNLTYVDLSYNSFSGVWELDTLLSRLPNLTLLDLSYSGLSVVTNNATDQVYLDFRWLGLASCNLTVFPKSLRAMKSLQHLDLSYNHIEGFIPDWAAEIGGNNLLYLNLSYNSIIGLPQFHWDGLESLNLQSNQIQGPFPPSICGMNHLLLLDMSNNSFSGVIPQCLGSISSSLLVIDLGANKFQGSIPNVNDDCGLNWLILKGNQLEGEVPTSLRNCQDLEILDLGNNQLNGTFPRWSEDFPDLQILILKSNNFHGPINTSTTSEVSFQSLQLLDLSHNRFEGHLPRKYFQNCIAMKNVAREVDPELKYLSLNKKFYSINVAVKGHELLFLKVLVEYTIVDLSNNKFGGEIPDVVGGLKSLKVLNLSHNSLSGRIPQALGNLMEMESLDLSCNQLTGEIPWSLAGITALEVLNLSQNHLVGRIPEGRQFNTFEGSSFGGNSGLCGFQLLNHSCEHPNYPQLEADGDEVESGFTWKVPVMLGYICGTPLGLLMGYVMLSTGKPKWFSAIANAGERMIMRRSRRNKRRYIYIGK